MKNDFSPFASLLLLIILIVLPATSIGGSKNNDDIANGIYRYALDKNTAGFSGLGQSTSGNKSPLINAKNSYISYNDDVEGRIISDLREMARKCMSDQVTMEQLKPELESMVLYKKRAVPLILEFASNYTGTEGDPSSPTFLHDYRSQLIKNRLFDALFYALYRIYTSDPTAQKYILDILDPSKESTKEALFLGYYMWRLPSKDIANLMSKWLNNRPAAKYDPLRKVMLRSYLSVNTQGFSIRPVQPAQVNNKGFDHYLSEGHARDIDNGDIFIKHLNQHLYISLESKEDEIRERSIIFPEIEKIVSPRRQYLYGFDFYDMESNNLSLEDTLLGKSYFEKSILRQPLVYNSTLLECSLRNTVIETGWIQNSQFIGGDLENLYLPSISFRRHTALIDTLLSDVDLTGSTFIEVDFLNTTFKDCHLKKSPITINNCLLLNVSLAGFKAKKLMFSNSTVDEQTLNNIKALPGFAEMDYRIDEVQIDKSLMLEAAPIDFFDERAGKFWEDLYRIKSGLQSFAWNRDVYDRAKKIIESGRLFTISRKIEHTPFAPQRRYAYVLAMINKCSTTYPDEKEDFEDAKILLKHYVESEKKFAGVGTDPSVAQLIDEVKPEVDRDMAFHGDFRVVCTKLTRGKFGLRNRFTDP